MNLRRCILFALLLLVSVLTGGQLSAASAANTLARLHWLGLKQISADTNAAQFMSVWQLPQTAALVAQTLDKFSRWPGGGATNAASQLLRPLLDDLVSSESYVELRAPTNSQPSSIIHHPSFALALALRLPPERARLWQTNLAAALEALTGLRSVPAATGWSLRKHEAPDLIEFSRVGDWTLVGLGSQTNDLLSDFAARITRDHAPFARSATNFWCVADLDPSRLADCFPLSARWTGGEGRGEVGNPFSIPNHLSFTAIGEAGNVLTRGTFSFSNPLDSPLPSWEIPTNFIHQPLSSFTAVRGLAPWLAASPEWQTLQLTPPPDQAFIWALPDMPLQTYFAAPLTAATNQISQLANRLVQNANPWLTTNAGGNFAWQTNPPSLVWNGALLFSPFLKPVVVNQHDYVLGGLVQFAEGNPNPMPAEFLHTVLGTSNLVYYQSEQTGVQVDANLFITQLSRLFFHKPQLPITAAATVWLKKAEPLLGDSTTTVIQTGPEQLAFTRRSTVGFTALELHLLADWLESPQFPHGLHTFLAPPDKQP